MNASSSFIALAGLLALVGGCEPREAAPPSPIRPVLSVVAEEQGSDNQAFTGTVEPAVSADLSFQVLGQLISRKVGAGDLVAKGETLATIDPTALELAVRAAAAEVRNRKAELENARASAGRIDALKASGTASQSIWEAAHTAVDAADARMRQAEADVAKARDALTFATLKADFDGVVTGTGAEVGQTVAPGAPVVTLAKPDPRDAVIDVPDWMAGQLSLGQSFRAALQIAPDRIAHGLLREIAPQSDALTRTRRLKIGLSDPSELFRLGSTVTVIGEHGSVPVIVLPASVLFERDGKPTVWVVTPDGGKAGERPTGTVSARAVTESTDGSDGVVVTAGLKAGERVVSAGVHRLDDGQRVAFDGDEP